MSSNRHQGADGLPASVFVRIKSIVAPVGPLPMSRSTFYAQVRAGQYPAPIRLGPRISAWPGGGRSRSRRRARQRGGGKMSKAYRRDRRHLVDARLGSATVSLKATVPALSQDSTDLTSRTLLPVAELFQRGVGLKRAAAGHLAYPARGKSGKLPRTIVGDVAGVRRGPVGPQRTIS